LDYLSNENSKAVTYLFQSKKDDRKKLETLNMMSKHLKRSKDILKRSGVRNYENYERLEERKKEERMPVYRGMDREVFKEVHRRLRG
jgi:hypothetical protein